MRPLWKRVGEHPNTKGLHPSVAAEVLLCAGILTSLIGSRDEIKEANEWARDLLTESITYYEITSRRDQDRMLYAQNSATVIGGRER